MDQTSRNQMHRRRLPRNSLHVASGFQGVVTRAKNSRTGTGNLAICDEIAGRTTLLGVGKRTSVPSQPSTIGDAWVSPPSDKPNESIAENPAHVPAVARVARSMTAGVKATPAALKRIHHGKASLQIISWIICARLGGWDLSVIMVYQNERK